MAKGLYKEWQTEEGLIRLKGWALDGLVDADIAHNMGIHVSTLYEWKLKYSDIADALKQSKEVADRRVENALFNSCFDRKIEVLKAFKVKDIQYSDTGKKISETEKVITATEEVAIKADTTSQIFWLKNRMTDKYRDVKPVEITGANGSSLNIKVTINDEVDDKDK